MSHLIDLTGVKFKGKFWKNPEKAERELKMSGENPGWFTEKERAQIMKDVNAYDFELEVFNYDSNTGLFIAEGNDSFGKSGIVGLFGKPREMYAGIVTFEKIYLRKKDTSEQHLLPEINFNNSLRRLYYSGTYYSLENGKIEISGRYTEPHIRSEFGGQWILSTNLG